jgi:hypothetical protein
LIWQCYPVIKRNFAGTETDLGLTFHIYGPNDITGLKFVIDGEIVEVQEARWQTSFTLNMASGYEATLAGQYEIAKRISRAREVWLAIPGEHPYKVQMTSDQIDVFKAMLAVYDRMIVHLSDAP